MGQFTAIWDCNEVVKFYSSNNTVLTALTNATKQWQTAANISGLPQFYSTSSDSTGASAWVTADISGSPFCGEWVVSTRTLYVYSGNGCSNFNDTGTLEEVLVHELGHAFGWTGSGTHKAGVAGVSDQCAMYLDNDGHINDAICPQEIECAAAAYGIRTLPTDFWSRKFVIGTTDSLVPDTVQVGNTVPLSPGNLLLERGGTLPGSFNWYSSDTSVATVSGGTVTGRSTGNTTITAKPSYSGSHPVTSHFNQYGVTTTVTVIAAEPVNLAVTEITRSGVDTLPIYDPGNYVLTAHLGPGDRTGVSFQWTIIFSNALGDSTVSPSGSPPWGTDHKTITIPSPIGSYTVTARVRVARVTEDTTIIGIVQTSQDFPVCPRPLGNDLRDGPPGAGTHRVAYC